MGGETVPSDFDELLDAAMLSWRLREIRAGRVQPDADDLRILRGIDRFLRMHRERQQEEEWELLLGATDNTPATEADTAISEDTAPGRDKSRPDEGRPSAD